MKKFQERRCLMCSELFFPSSTRQNYCGSNKKYGTCSYKHKNIKNAEYVKMWRKTESGKISTKSAQARCINKKVRERLLELLDNVKNLESESYPAVFGDEDVVRLSDVQELIKKKI